MKPPTAEEKYNDPLTKFEDEFPEEAAALAALYRPVTPPRKCYPWPATVERNDPCPCASGRKYKKCCGDIKR